MNKLVKKRYRQWKTIGTEKKRYWRKNISSRKKIRLEKIVKKNADTGKNSEIVRKNRDSGINI